MNASLWFTPLVLLAVGVALGLVLPQLDAAAWRSFAGILRLQAIRPSPTGVSSLLSTAANALATVLSVGFSITMVTVQLSASQYTPRLLRSFMADAVTQRVLGIFLGTVAYLELVLWAVRSPDRTHPDGFVPAFSVWVALALMLGCLGLVAVFLHHVTRSVQPATIIARVGRETMDALAAVPDTEVSLLSVPFPDDRPADVASHRTGYLQAIDQARLHRVLPKGVQAVRINARPGDFVFPGISLLSLWPAQRVDETTQNALRSAFGLGRERTLEQDILFGVRQLVDMALRALSPAINDVTTAHMVVNELAAITRRVMERPAVCEPFRVWRQDERWYRSAALEFELFLHAAFGEIAAAAVDQPRVLARMLEIHAELASLTHDERLREALQDSGRGIREVGGQRPAVGVHAALVDDRWNLLEQALHGESLPTEQPPIQ